MFNIFSQVEANFLLKGVWLLLLFIHILRNWILNRDRIKLPEQVFLAALAVDLKHGDHEPSDLLSILFFIHFIEVSICSDAELKII